MTMHCNRYRREDEDSGIELYLLELTLSVLQVPVLNQLRTVIARWRSILIELIQRLAFTLVLKEKGS